MKQTPPVKNETNATSCASQTPAGSTNRAAGRTPAGVFLHIPEELRKLKQWHVWLDRDGVKLPKQPNGSAAKSNDPATWTDFETAVDASQFFSGLAFELSPGITGIDLDDCIDADGNVRQWAWPIIARFDGVAYCEISPSGRGMKLTTLGSKPAGSRCVHKIDGKQQIECYDNARFWTMTGKVYNQQTAIGDGQAAIDWLCETHLQQTVQKPPARTTPSQTRLPGGSALGTRASAYIDAVPPAGTGGRNNAAFNLAGHLHAITDESGRTLTIEQVIDLMRDWNARNPEPLSDDELAHATHSSLRNGTPREVKSPTERVEVDDSLDISELLQSDRTDTSKSDGVLTFEDLAALAENEEIEEAEATSLPIPLPKEVFTNAPGWIALFYHYLMNSAQKQLPEAFLAAALAIMSVVTGQTYRFPYGQWDTRSNLYLICLAGSGAGKDYARTVIAKLIRQIDTGIMRGMLGPSKFASDAGMLSSLNIQSRQLWLMDEFSKFLGSLSNAKSGTHITNMAELLLELFSESANPAYQAKAYAEAKRSITLNQPHTPIYGTTTPEDCWQNLTVDQIKDGLGGRLLFFEDQYSPPKSDTTIQPDVDEDGCVIVTNSSLHEELPAEIIAIPAACYDQAEVVNVRIRHDAWARLDEHHRRIDRRRLTEDPMRAALWSRAGEKTSKLSMIATLARGEAIITIDDVNWAILLTNALTRRMVQRVGSSVSENQQDGNVKKMLSIIEKAGGISRRDLTRRTQMFTSRDRSAMLNDLLVSEQVVAVKLRRKTKTGEWFGTSYRSILEAVKTKF